MNEELIRQCAREAALEEFHDTEKSWQLCVSDGERAIRLYHARAVAPLVEAAERFSRLGFFRADEARVEDFAALTQALAALGKGEE